MLMVARNIFVNISNDIKTVKVSSIFYSGSRYANAEKI